MINIKFGVVKQNLELLQNIVNEVSEYGIWSVFYGDEEISNIKNIEKRISKLKEELEQLGNESIQLELSFREGQVLKKVIVFYLTNNFKNLRRSQFETISDFILFVDDSLAFYLEDNGIQ